MPPKTLNKKTAVKQKNAYVKSLIKDLSKINDNELKTTDIDLSKVNIKEAVTLVKQNIESKKLAVKLDNNKKYFLNDNTIDKLQKGLIDENAEINNNEIVDSDQELKNIVGTVKRITIETVEPDPSKDKRYKITGKTNTKREGAFFKFLNNTKFDFSKYGIFNEVDARNYDDNCFYIACKEAGMPENELQMLKIFITNRFVPYCKIKEIANTLQVAFKVTSRNKDGKSRTETIGDCALAEYIYHIGLIDEHYFVYEKTDVTSYCLKHYEAVKDEIDCHKIYAKSNERFRLTNKQFITSFELFKLLLDNKDTLLKPIYYDEEIMKTQFYDKVSEYKTLEYPNSCIKYQKYEPKPNNDYYKVYFDFETDTSEYTHKPYLCCYETEDGIQREFIGENCAIDMLNNLPDKKNIMLIAHNADYDVRFLLKYLSPINMKTIVKGGRFLSITAEFTNILQQKINLKIKDSNKLIQMKLANFGKSFKLDVQKEIMPYKIYTEENIKKRNIPILKAIYHVSDKDRKQFIENIDKWGCRVNKNDFDIIKYSSEYCRMDCSVLRKGYDKFREWILEHTKLDIDDFITIQSLASDYKLKSGCYDDVAMFSGVVQHYISNCIVGGRCMTNSNKMYHVERKLADFDGVSLYPSSMHRISGYLKGKPKVLKNLSYDFIKDQDGYFIRIKITKIGKDRQFPLLSKINDNGVRIFSNDLVNEVIFIDKTSLEDAKKFQSIEFEIIDGYFFNEGRNDKINEVIKDLFDLRAKLKKENNPANDVIKLLMNSMYGKTILKPIETDTKVICEKRWSRFVNMNYNYIQSSIEVNGKHYVKVIKSINNHYNYCHCGVEILSMSKRIMNEVMCLAEDFKLSIYYQDTDSMHINYEDVEILEKEFKNEYDRELIGKGLGQFHIDFDMFDDDGEKITGLKDIYAKESYFLAKKVYIDKLEGIYENGDVINDDHIRMKSVPTSCIKYTSKENELEPIDLYKKLYDEKQIYFDLTENGDKCGFKNEKDFSVRSYQPKVTKIKKGIEYEESEFCRRISFSDKIERIPIDENKKLVF